MKKIIIIVLMTIITNPSIAKTKVYGELHVAYERLFPVGFDSKDNLSIKNSLLGFKGVKNIRTDLSLIYQFAWGLSDDSFEDKKNKDLNNRNQAIGLASSSGAVIIGRFDTPFKTVGRKADLFWHSQLGQNRVITNANTWDLRADKMIVYQSPRYSGFQSSLAYASDISDTSGITDNASAISLNTFYRKENWRLGLAYEKHKLKRSSAKREALRLSAEYKTRQLKLVGFFQDENNATTLSNIPDANVFGVGIAYKIRAGTLKAQYYSRDNDLSSKDPSLLALGYDHKISKNVDIYAQAASVTKGLLLSGDTTSTTIATTDKDRGIALGIRYKF